MNEQLNWFTCKVECSEREASQFAEQKRVRLLGKDKPNQLCYLVKHRTVLMLVGEKLLEELSRHCCRLTKWHVLWIPRTPCFIQHFANIPHSKDSTYANQRGLTSRVIEHFALSIESKLIWRANSEVLIRLYWYRTKDHVDHTRWASVDSLLNK